MKEINSDIKIERLKAQPENESFLFRYVTIDKLIDTLINGRIPLTQLKQFEDKLEGITTQHLLLNLTSDKIAENLGKGIGGIFQHITTNINPTNRNSLSRKRAIFQEFNFANCWFESDHESIAMWQLYSNSDSVALKIPYKDVIKEIDNKEFELSGYDHTKLKYGKVHYVKFNDIDNLQSLVVEDENIQGFVKDKSFSHESEFRLMLSIKEKEHKKAERKEMVLDEQIDAINNRQSQKNVYLKFKNFNSLPIEIIFHPKSKSWHRQNIKAILEKYELDFKQTESSLKRIFE